MIASVITSSAAIMLSLAGQAPSLATILTATILLSLGIFALKDVIARHIFNMLVRRAMRETGRSPLGEDEIFEFPDRELEDVELEEALEEEPEHLFLAWFLVDRIRRKLAPHARETVLFVHVAGVPYYSYPENAIAEIDEEEDEEEVLSSSVAARLTRSGRVEVWLGISTYRKLERTLKANLRETERGETLHIDDPETLSILYRIAKEIYRASNPEAPPDFAAYYALKTILSLEREKTITIAPRVWDTVRLEQSELWTRIRKQLEEEGVLDKRKHP